MRYYWFVMDKKDIVGGVNMLVLLWFIVEWIFSWCYFILFLFIYLRFSSEIACFLNYGFKVETLVG